jgi:hypothetical protein
MKQRLILLIIAIMIMAISLTACSPAVTTTPSNTQASAQPTSQQASAVVTSEATALADTASSAVAAPAGAPPQGTPPAGGPGGQPPSGSPPAGAPGAPSASTTNPVLTSTCGAYTVDGKTVGETGQTYASSTADQSSICVINGAAVTLTNATITKSGDSSSSESSSFYGLNAAVLSGSSSKVSLSGGTITANGVGANGAFATGQGSSVTLSGVTIKASGDGAHAVMATLGGEMTLTGVDMTTTDTHSGAVATDRGGGTITVTGGSVTTTGQDSPAIYSTGAITVTGAKATATGAEAAVIEGGNSITLVDTDLSTSIADKWGVMIYQSMSGDAEGTRGVFTMTGGSLASTAATGPLFYVNNSTGVITLKNVKVTAESGTLLDASANSRWGNSGSNGGNIILTADQQALSGNMTADNISTIDVTLKNGSALTGALNSAHTAKTVNLALDASSTWSVTADSYLTCLTDADGISGTSVTNITGNGHTVYYDAASCAGLGGKTHYLNGGGTLQPLS